MIEFFDHWQQLIGALLGAALPISFWIVSGWWQSYTKRKRALYILQKDLVLAIDNLSDIRKTIQVFIEERLSEAQENVQNSPDGQYFAGSIFFPLMNVFSFGRELLTPETKSVYLDNQIVRVVLLSNGIATSIDDARRQFQETVELNRIFSINKSNPPVVQKREFRENINLFISFANEMLLQEKGHARIYLSALIATLLTLRQITKPLGILRWRFRFDVNYKIKYFRYRKDFIKFKEQTFDRIDTYFKPEVQKFIGTIEAEA